MTPQEKRKQTIRKQEKAKFKAFLERRDMAEEYEAQAKLYEYMKAKGRNTFPFSYED